MAAAYLNERYGERMLYSKRGQLTKAERGWLESAEKERRTLLLVVIGTVLLLVGIVSLFL